MVVVLARCLWSAGGVVVGGVGGCMVVVLELLWRSCCGSCIHLVVVMTC